MADESLRPAVVIDVDGLDALLAALRHRGYEVTGPTRRDAAIVHDRIDAVEDLPTGWTEEQDAGCYRLSRRDDDALFGYAVGPHSWKQELFPSRSLLWSATRTDDGFVLDEPTTESRRRAFIGVRSCDLAAIAVLDNVLGEDPTYQKRRDTAIIAVNCTDPGGTCFCVSMGTGPAAESGFDLALTELADDGDHRFVVEVGTQLGKDLLDAVPHRPADRADLHGAGERIEGARQSMGRHLESGDLQALLASNLEHPRWDDVATRCLTCANCTMVCPTCFCSSVEDTTDLASDHAERWRTWDSCFTLDHSYLHGGNVRSSPRSRYRQWLTHKFGTWWDQFDTSGCVGCGRCITWCPVGIDVTEELAAIRSEPSGGTPVALRGRSGP